MRQFFQNLFKKKETEETQNKECCVIEQSHSAHDFALSPEAFHDLLKTEKTIKLIDVRTKEEYDEGHIAGAVLLPVQELTSEAIEKKWIKKEDEILLYCRSGGRSGKALEIFQSLGYRNVKHLGGGILAWEEKKKSVQKSSPKNI